MQATHDCVSALRTVLFISFCLPDNTVPPISRSNIIVNIDLERSTKMVSRYRASPL